MKYFTKFLCQFVSFFLVFAIGFLSCIGVVVGGVAFAYCNVSIDKLNEWGMGLDTSGIFDPKADVPVNSLTLETLLGEILGIKGNAGKYSLQDLIDRYGLILPDEVAKYLPSDVILNTAFETLVSQDGLVTVLKNTPLNYLLQFVPEGVISDEAKETMGNVSLYDIIFPEDEKYGSFLHGIQLGFFLGVTYEKNADGTYTVKYVDEQHPTLLELLAPIDLGLVLSLFTDPTAPESTPANVVYKSLGHISYADLLYSVGLDISTIEIADNVLRGRSVGDLFRDSNGDGVFELYAPGAFHDLYVGTILGTAGEIRDDVFVVDYADPDHPTILELIAPLSIGGLVSSLLDPDYGKKPLEVVFDTLGEIEFNHLFGTFLQLDKLGMEQALAGKKVKDLVTIDPDTGMPKLDVPGLFDGVFLGDFLNVKSVKNCTVDENGKKHWTYEVASDDTSAPVAQLLGYINIGTIMDALLPADGNFDPNKVIDATYNQVSVLKFIDILHVFIPNTESITGLDKALGDKTIGTVLSFNVETGEFEFHIPDVFRDIYLADFFAYPYHFDADGTFVLDCEVDHPLKLIAHISAYDFVNAIFTGDIFRVLYDTFGRIRLDDIFGLVPNLIPARFDYLYKGWKIGDFIVYNGEKWSFETKAYMDAFDADRLAADLKEDPNPVVIGFVAALLAGRVAYLLFLNDVPFAEYVATTYNGSTLREAVDLVIDSEALRLDRLLEDINLGRAFKKNDATGEYEFFWYGLIENIAFDDLVYIAFDYEKNGVDAIFGDATIGDLFVCDAEGNYSFRPENVFEFIYLDDLLNFALSFAGKDLEAVGLGGLYDSLPLASLVVGADGKVTFLPDALFLNLKEDGTAWTEFKAAFENPTELRSLVLLGSFAVTVAVDYLLHRDDFRAIAFDDFIRDYNVDSQPFADIFGGKKVGDLFADPLSDLPKSAIRFFCDVRVASVLELFGLAGNDAVNTIVSDTAFGDIVYVDADDKIVFDGFAVAENIRFADLVKLTGYENEKLNEVLGDKRLGDLFHYDKDATPAFSFTPLKLLGDIAFRDVVEIFLAVEDGTPLAEILDALGTVDKLVSCDEDGRYHFTPVEWIADIRFTAVIEVTKVQELIDRDLSVIFRDKTVGDVLFYEDEELRFEWFNIFRDISFNDLIGLIGLPDNISAPLTRLFTETDGTDKTIGSLLSFERGTGLKVTWYSFVDDMHVFSEIVHIIGYENDNLEKLLSGITVGSIISYDDATGKVSVNEIDYIAFSDLADLILGFLGTSLAEKGIDDLFDGLSVASVLTFTDGFSFTLDPVVDRLDRADLSGVLSSPTSVRSLTVAGVLLAWVLTGYFLNADDFRANAFDDYIAQFEIGTAYGHEKREDYVAALFAGKTFGDLLPADLADFPTTLVRFFGDMSFYTPFGVLGVENEHLHNLLDEFRLDNILFVNDSGAIDFHLENLDQILFSEILLLAGIDNETLLDIVDGMSLAGLISYNYNEKKFEFTPLGLIADVRLNAFFGFLTLDDDKRAALDRMFDTRIGDILFKDADGRIVFRPFAMTDKIAMTDILFVAGIAREGNEDLYDLLEGKTLRDVITSDDQTLQDVSVTLFETLFGYEVYDILKAVAPLSDPEAWQTLLGHRRFSDLFSFTGLFRDFKVTFDNFFGTMKFTDILYAAAGIEGENVEAVLGDNTIGTILRISPEFSVEFTPFRMTDTISLNAILTLAGYENEKVTALLSGITIADIVTSEDGGFENIRVNAIHTLLAFRVASVIGLFYENEKLNALLGNRRFDDLVKVTGMFEDVTVTFDDFFGTMALRDIAAVFAEDAVAAGKPLAGILGDKTIGTVISVSPKFAVTFTPFRLTDDVALNDLLALAGVEDGKVTDLFSGITLADFVTSEDGTVNNIRVNAIQTLLAFRVVSVIGLFYESEALSTLLGDRRFDDLVMVTGLFEKVEVTFDNFFGTMKFTDILYAAAGIEGENVEAVFGDSTIGTVLSVSPEFKVTFTPFALTDTITVNSLLILAGIEDGKVTDLFSGIALADFVTSEDGSLNDIRVNAIQTLLAFKVANVIGLFYENEKLNALLGNRRFDDLVKVTGLFEDVTVTFDDFFGTMALCDIVAVFAADLVADGKPLASILDDTRIGDILSISPEFSVKFSPFALTDDVLLTDVLALFGITEGKIVDLLAGIRGRDLVTMEDDKLTVNAIGTLLSFRILSVIGLFYEEENLTKLLGDRRFDDLVKVTGLFETVEFTWYDFVRDMMIVDILRACYIDRVATTVDLDALFGVKTIGDLLAQDEDGANLRLTLRRFFEDEKIIGFGAILDAVGLDAGASYTEALYNLLGNKYIADLLSFDDDNNLTLTWDTFIADMALSDFVRLAGVDADGEYIVELLGGKTLGTIVGKNDDGTVRFTPFALTDDMKVNTILAIAGIEDAKVTALFDGITLADFVTSPDGTINDIEINAVQTVFGLSLVKLIGLFYENDALTRLLTSADGSDKSVGTLVQVTGLFESVNFDIDAFVGNMALSDIVALTGYENEKLNALIGGSTIGDYYSFNDNQLQKIDFITLDGIVNFALSFADTDLATLGLSGIIDGVKVSDIAVVAGDGSVSFTAQPIIDNINTEEELQAILDNPTSVRSLLFITVGTVAVLCLWFFDRDTILDLAFIPDLLGETEDADFRAVFGDKTVRDLLGDGDFTRLHINATGFLAGVPLKSLVAVFGVKGHYVNELLGGTTFDDVLSLDDAEQFHFRPFALTDPMRLTDILGLCGIEDEKINNLLDGVTMEDIVTSPHKTVYNIRINAIDTLLSLKVAGVTGLFFENEKLSALLGDRRFNDLVKVTGLFEKTEITFDNFFGDMRFADILAVFGAEGSYIDELFGEKTIGTVLSISPAFDVTFTPFLLTDDMRINTILAVFGIRADGLTTLLDGIALSDLVTSDDGSLSAVRVNAVATLLSLRVADVIALFYENANLDALLGDRRFNDLVKVTGLFESVSITFDDFFGTMALCDIVAVFASDMVSDGQPLAAILSTTRIGDIISVSSDFRVKISPFALTDNILLTDILALFGAGEGKLAALLEGIRGRDLVTMENGNLVVGAIDTVLHFTVADVIGLFYENEKLNDLLGEKQWIDLVQINGLFESISFTFDAFFGDMKWTDIVAVFGVEGVEINELFGDSTVGTVISVDSNYNVILTPFLLTDGMRVNTLLSMAGVTDEKVKALLDGITLGDVVTSPDGSVFGVTFPVIQTLLSFRVAQVIGLFYENEKLNTLLGERRFDDLAEVVGMFEEIHITFDRFFGDMAFTDIFAVAGMEGEYLNDLFGRKTIGTLITISSELAVTFTPFAVTDDMEINTFLTMAGVGDGKLTALLEGITLGDLVTSPDGTPDQIEITAIDTLLSFEVAQVIGLFYEEENLTKLLGDRRFDDLVKVTGLFETVEFTWYDFVRDMMIVDILRACYIDRVATTVDLDALFGIKTIGDLLAQDEDGANLRLTLRRFFEDEKIIGFGAILDAVGLDAGASYTEALYNLLGNKYIADLLSFDDDNNLTLTWDTFIADMALSDFVRLAGVDADGEYIVELLGGKTLGTIVGKNDDGTVRFTPFMVTDDMKIDTLLKLAGIENDKLSDLVAGMTIADIITSDDGTVSNIRIDVIRTLLSFRVVQVIGLVYESEELNNLLGERRFNDLVKVTGLFEDVTVTFDDFFGTMAIADVLALFGVKGQYIDELFTETQTGARGRARSKAAAPGRSKTIGDLVKISSDFVVTFTPFTVTDSMQINTFLKLAGIENSKINDLAEGITLSDIITSEDGGLNNIQLTAVQTIPTRNVAQFISLFYENEKLNALLGDRCFDDLIKVTGFFEKVEITFDDFFGTMAFTDILAVFGIEGLYIDELFTAKDADNGSAIGSKTVGDLVKISPEFAVTFTPFAVTDSMQINTFLKLAGIQNSKISDLTDGITLSDIVTSDDGTVSNIKVNVIDTVFGLSLLKLVGLFYENEALTRLLTAADGSDKSIGTLVQVEGLFESVSLDIDAFVGNMALSDIVALTGYENEKLTALIGDSTIGSYYSFNDKQLQNIDFITLDGIVNFVLSFAGTDLATLGLDGIIDGVKVGQIVVVAGDGSISFTAQPVIDNIDINAEVKAIMNDPTAVRSIVLVVTGVAAVTVLWFFDRDVLLNMAFVPDLLGETEDADIKAVFADKTLRDLLGEGFGRLHINAVKFFAGVPLKSLAAVLGVKGHYVNELLDSTTFDMVVSVDEAEQFHFKPFALTDPMLLTDILGLCGVKDEKVNTLLDGITMEDIVTSPHKTVYGIKVPVVQTLLALRVANVIGLFYENDKLNTLLGDRRFDDLVKVTGLFEKVEVTFDDFFGSMKFTDILAAAGIEGANVTAVFGDSTIGTVLSVTPAFEVTFTPFTLTDTISVNSLLALAGVGNEKVTTLFDGVTIADIVTSENGDLNGIQLPVVQTALSREAAQVIGLFYENDKLNTLLGNRRFDDLVKVTGLFESVSVTFDDFFGAMALSDIVAVFAADKVADGQPLAAILGTTRVGDVISVPSDFRVKFSPCALTDNVLLTDVLALFGVTEGKVVKLLDQLHGRDIATINGGNLEITLINTLLHFEVADVIGLFYENAALRDLLGEKCFEDLVQVTGLFESVSFTFNAFFGDMKWTAILKVFGFESAETNELFGEKTIGTLVSVDDQYMISFTPYAVTDDMRVNTLIRMAGVNNEKLEKLLDSVTLGDILTSDSKGVQDTRFTVIDTVLTFRLKDIADLTGVSHQLVDALCTEKTFGSFLSYTDGKFAFSFSGLFGDVNINAVLDGLLSFVNRSLAGWDMTYLFEGYVVTDLFLVEDGKAYQGFNKVAERITDNKDKILETIKSDPFGEPSLIYIGAGVVAVTVIMITDRGSIMDADIAKTLGFAEDTYLYLLFTGKTLSGLINLSGSDFNSIFTWYDFVSDMKLSNILGALRVTDERLLRLVGNKDVSELVAPNEEGSYKFTVVEFLGNTTIGEIIGTDGYNELFADICLVDVYNLARGTDDILSVVGNRMGGKLLYDLAKIVLGGEHARGKIVLGDLKVSDIIVPDGDGNYSVSFVAVKKIPFGSLFGYTKNADDQKWYDMNGKPVTGIMAAIADMTYSNFDSNVGDIRIGELLGYEQNPTDKKWYDENGAEVDGLMKAFVNLTINEMSNSEKLNGAVNTLCVKDVLGLTKDEKTGKWTKDGAEVAPVIAALAESTIGSLETDINGVKLGQVAGFTYNETDGKWYDGTGKATGVLAAMADLTIAEMQNSQTVINTIQTIVVGDALGYTKKDGVWYDGDDNVVTGIMSVVVDKPIGEIQFAVDEAPIGTVLGYTMGTDGIWTKDGKEPDGYVALIGPDTMVKELDSKVAGLADTSIGRFMEVGLIETPTLEQQEKLDLFFGDLEWRDLSLKAFFNALIERI